MRKIYLILAAIFLFNPILSIIDIFPDFIGYIFLFMCFKKTSYIDEKTDELCKSIKIMILITAGKVIALLMMPSLDQTMYLVFSFVFAVLEIIFSIPVFTKMFEIMSKLSLSIDNVKCANNSKIAKFTIGATVAKLVLATLPDFTLLDISNGVDTPTGLQLSYFRYTFFIFSIFLSTIIGTIWLIRFIVYSCQFLKKELKEGLDNEFKEKTKGRESLFVSKDSKYILVIMCIASLFVIDFNFNQVNIFPDSIFSIIVAISFAYLFIKRYFKNVLGLIIVSLISIAHLIVDILMTMQVSEFFDRFNLESIERNPDAETSYFLMSTYAVISALLFIANVVVVVLLLRKNAYADLDKYGLLLVEKDKTGILKEYKADTKRNITLVFIFTGICALQYAIYMIFRHLAGGLIVLTTISEIAFIFVFIKNVLYIHDNVYKRILAHS